jgi:hypothetical protein
MKRSRYKFIFFSLMYIVDVREEKRPTFDHTLN